MTRRSMFGVLFGGVAALVVKPASRNLGAVGSMTVSRGSIITGPVATTIGIELDGKVIAQAIVPYIPGEKPEPRNRAWRTS